MWLNFESSSPVLMVVNFVGGAKPKSVLLWGSGWGVYNEIHNPKLEAMAGDPIHPLMDDCSLLSCFGREGDKPIPDAHLDQISRTCSKKWRYLPAHLELPDSMVDDTEHDGKNEEERRHIFFFGWKKSKGSRATYRKLVNAFLKIECREDAEKVCKFLKESVQPPSPPVRSKSQATGSYSHNVEIPTCVHDL